MKKILLLISLASMIVIIAYSIYEYTQFTILNTERDITDFIQEHLGELDKKPLLLETYPIKHTMKVVATFEHNENQLGAVIFHKGFYGKLKLEKIMLDSSFYSEIIETKKGTFILFIGENKQTAIQTIVTDIVSSGERVRLTVPPQKYFSQIQKIEDFTKIDTEPTYIYRTLKEAISGTNSKQGMELMFVDEAHQSFLIYSEENSVLKTILGAYKFNEHGFEVTGMERANFYSMKEDKDFCFEEKK
ncbi:hypothetical protein [Bacillus sp. CHD6a]|uniref:hypothetical protein n=1 Tax=Bacillus sp. CHD6a TaxID=1643452 RepID=UPI0006CDE51D|nr:hypothetical protein [Bacillus sp. CHD6a]KPB04983.1 hypothetical protein AAV98_09770 [Bacillus sp. CHD6a]